MTDMYVKERELSPSRSPCLRSSMKEGLWGWDHSRGDSGFEIGVCVRGGVWDSGPSGRWESSESYRLDSSSVPRLGWNQVR